MGQSNFDPIKIIGWLSSLIENPSNEKILAGVDDDDCAIIESGKGYLILTVDFLNASPIAVELGIAGPRDLGKLLVAASLSDLCGTGASPTALLLAIMLNKHRDDDYFKEIIRGANEIANKYEVPIVGGDTKIGKHDSLASIGIGKAQKRSELFTKKDAEPGDIIWLSGHVGSVAASLYGLKNGYDISQWKDWAKKVLIEPELPVTKIRKVSNAEIGKAGTDISDGLGFDLNEICRLSKVGAEVFVNEIPIKREVHEISNYFDIPSWHFPFTIGGEFQSIVTTDAKRKTLKLMKTFGFFKVGKIIKNDLKIVDGKKEYKMPITGHNDSNSANFTEEINYLLNKIQ